MISETVSGGGMPFTIYARLAGCTLWLQGTVAYSWGLHGVGNKVSTIQHPWSAAEHYN
jgi:hypothetical protein